MSKLLALLLLIPSISFAQYLGDVDLPVRISPTGTIDVNCVSGCSGSGGGFAGTTNYVVNPVTATVSGIVSVTNLFSGTTVYLVNPTTSTVSGSVAVTNLYTGTTVYVVNNATVSVTNFPASQAVTGTFWQATQPISGSVGLTNLVTTSYIVNPSTVTQGTAGTSAWKFDLSTGVQVNQGTPGTVGWKTDFSTGVQVNTGTKYLSVETSTGLPVVGMVAENVTVAGNPIPVGVRVSSNAFNGLSTSNGKVVFLSADPAGRLLVTGVPWGMIQSSYSAIISSAIYGTSGPTGVLISSTGANTSAYICGCTFTNSAATGAMLRLASPVSATTTSSTQMRMEIGSGVNFVPVVIPHNCEQPFFRSAPNTSVSLITTGTAVMTGSVYCTWYVAP